MGLVRLATGLLQRFAPALELEAAGALRVLTEFLASLGFIPRWCLVAV
jgi:hypothetical protein